MWVAEYISGIVTTFDGKIGITKINLDEYSLKSMDCDYYEIIIDYLCPCHDHSVDDICNCYTLPSRISYEQVVCGETGGGESPITVAPPTTTYSTNNTDRATGAGGAIGLNNSSETDNSNSSLTSTLLPFGNSNIEQITLVNNLLGIELGEVADIPIKNPNYIDLHTFLEEGKHVAWDKYGGSYYKCKGMWVYYRNGQYYVDQTGEGYWKKATLRTTRLTDELTYLIGTAAKDAALTVLKYLTPAEEAYILLEGKYFDGLEQSQITSGVFLILAVIPGTKVLKPVAKITNKASRYFVSIGGELLELVAEKGIAKFTRNSVKVLAKKATRNASKTEVMLGKESFSGTFPYFDRAGTEYKHFRFDGNGWSNLFELVNSNTEEMWKINKKFIDDAKTKGNQFFLSHDPNNPLIRQGFYKM